MLAGQKNLVGLTFGLSCPVLHPLRDKPDYHAGSRLRIAPNTLADGPVFVPRPIICPFFRAMRHLLAGIRAHNSHTREADIRFYWGSKERH